MPTLYIIDGNSYIHRAYHALPPLTTSKGEQINAVYGFLRMILKIIKSFRPDYMLVCFDMPGKTFRHEQYADYKATRKETDEELKRQIPLSKEVPKALGIPIFEKEGFEADDLIATISRKSEKKGIDTVIVTGDKDALQLVGAAIKVLNEPKDVLYDEEKVKERYGVSPGQIIDLFALMGDKTDNVPGIRGIGEKTAVKLISEFGSLDNLLANAEKVPGKTGELLKESREDALKSRELVKLDSEVDVDFKLEECTVKEPLAEKIIPLIKRLEVSADMLRGITAGAPAESASKCVMINSIEELEEVIAKKVRGEVSLATGAAGISLSAEKGVAYFLPYVGETAMEMTAQRCWTAPSETARALKPVLEDGGIKKYGHDLKSTMLFFMRKGMRFEGVYFDTMLASYCINPTRKSHGLKDIVLEYLSENMQPQDNCAAAEKVLRLAETLLPLLKEKSLDRLFFDVEMPLVGILAEMERRGIKVDIPYLQNLSAEFARQLAGFESDIYKLARRPFSINSPKQLAQVLFVELKLPPVKKTKTGFSTDEEVLRALAERHELPAKIISYREIQKLKSTYADALIENSDPRTNRIHTTFNQAVTATGRLSSSDPNLQNIPIRTETGRKIRRAFITGEDSVFISADYSQIDLRVLAHVSGDPALIRAFSAGKDIHTATAAEIFGVKEEEVTSDMRRFAKTINFGIVYGMSAFGLSQQLGIPQDEAKKYIYGYFEKYSGVRKWTEEIMGSARKRGYVSTLLNRIRYLPEINSKNPQMRSFAERLAVNTPIQGTSADIIKIAMIEIRRRLPGSFGCAMVLQIHDDLLFECPRKTSTEAAFVIKGIMENAVKLNVPLVIDTRTGVNWRDME